MEYYTTPGQINLTQSPVIVSAYWDGYQSSSGFQYICDLYFWTGSPDVSTNVNPSQPNYTLVKYPNQSGTGIFDLSRILNSTLDTPQEQSGSENVKWFTYALNFQYISGSSYLTSSLGRELYTSSQLALDGYQIFGEKIQSEQNNNSVLESSSLLFPRMTDGPTTQSVYTNCVTAGTYDDKYQPELYTTVAFYDWEPPSGRNGFLTTGYNIRTDNGNSFDVSLNALTQSRASGGITSSNDIFLGVDVSPSNIASLYETQYPSQNFGNVSWYEVDFLTYGNQPYNKPIRYEINPLQKWGNVQISFKNRYGFLDYFNFNMVNRKAMNISRSQYQPQIGNWNTGTNFTYQPYDSSIQNYLVDTKETLLVNTDWVSESYNDIFKQLLVSDEVYWVVDPILHKTSPPNGIKPITIKTSDISFKTGVNDKLIQYTFEFDFGTSYKLIL